MSFNEHLKFKIKYKTTISSSLFYSLYRNYQSSLYEYILLYFLLKVLWFSFMIRFLFILLFYLLKINFCGKKWDIGEVWFSSKLCFIYVFCSTSNGNQGLIHKMPTCSNNICWRYFLLRKLILGKLIANQVTRDISHDFYFVPNFSFGYNDLFSYTDLICPTTVWITVSLQ